MRLLGLCALCLLKPTLSASQSGTAVSPLVRECADAKPAWIFCDDFEVDRSRSYFEIVDANGGFGRATGVGVNGSFGARAQWKELQVEGGGLHLAFGRTPHPYMRPADGGTRDYREIFWRFYVRRATGWFGGGGEKLTRAMILADSSFAQAMAAHVWSGGSFSSTADYLILDPARGTNYLGALQTRKYNDFDRFQWLGQLRSVAPVFSEAKIGVWQCIEVHVRIGEPRANNGLFVLWVDGVPQARSRTMEWVGPYEGYGINAIYLENYWNAGSPHVQERMFDNFVVSTERIGC